MSLPHAILGLLEQEPMTGYDLKTHHFDRTVAHFWSADHTQIYRTLDKLAEQGLVESRLEIQEDHPNRKIYTLTQAGRDELERWLHTEQPLGTARDSFLIQLFFGASLPNAVLIRAVEGQIRAHEERLTKYHQIEDRIENINDSRRKTLHSLTLGCGLSREEAAIVWLKQAVETLKELEDNPTQ